MEADHADEVEVPSDEESTSSGYVYQSLKCISCNKVSPIQTSVSRHLEDSTNDSDPCDPYDDDDDLFGLPNEFLPFASSFLGSDLKKARLLHRQKESGAPRAEESFQKVKAAPSVQESSGAPPTLDYRKLEVKCKVLVNQLSKAVRFRF